jgi:CDP-4-dehydro-6-deoxyglucose reductase
MANIPAAIKSIEDRAGNVRILTLAPATPLTWLAGQYMHIGVEGYGSRAYSIASLPDDSGLIKFHIRNMGTGLSAHLAQNLKAGDTVGLKGPHGDMNTAAINGRPVLMVAGGTGIAPMLALSHDILTKKLSDQITLVYGARIMADIYCQQELDALSSTGKVTIHIVNDPQTPDLQLRQLQLDLSNHVIYVSGPDPMMLPVHAALADLGADRTRIFCDADMETLQKNIT